MKILEEAMKRKRKFKLKNERGSVTLFVLIAMLFFLIVGLIIFMSNMNNSTSQQRDVKKIQSEYNVNTSELDEIYNEQEKKQTGKLLISVTDSFGEIYESGKWIIKEETDKDNQMPLSVEITWPDGIKNSEKEIKIQGTINGEKIDITIDSKGITGTAPSNIKNLIETKDNILELKSGVDDCDIKVSATVNDKTSEVNVKVDRVLPVATISPNGGELWIDRDKGETTAKISTTINANDTNGSGIKEIYYQWNNSPDSVDESNWTKGNGTNFDVENNVGEGTYYLHVKIIDEAGNVNEVVSKAYEVREANYRIETQGKTDTYAETLEDAISKCENNKSKIVVVNTCTDDSISAEVDKNITIDTNGYVLTVNHSISVEDGKQLIITDNKTGENKGKIYNSTVGNLIDNSGTVVVNGAVIEATGVAIDGGNVTVTSGTVKGGTNAIRNTDENCVITIGDKNEELSNNGPIIEATNGKGIEITSVTTELHFDNGKIIGTQTTNVRGVDVAFSVADVSKVKYRAEYGAHTDKIGNNYETTLVKPEWNLNTETIYLNTTDDKEAEIEVTGTDIGTITYTSEDENIAEVEEDDNDNKKATVTAKDDGETKIIVKDENSETTKEITVIIDSIKPTITATPASTTVTKNINVTITAEDKGQSGLATDNSYQYAIVDSNTVAPTEGWKNYTSGTAFTMGEGETRTCYIWVKEVKDKVNNKSTENGTKVGTYHVFGPYIFDNSKPKVTITPNGNKTYAKSQSATVTVEDIGAAGINTSSLKYQWTQSEETPAENTFTESYTSGQTLTKDGVTGDNWYLWILAEDNAGNKITIHSEPFYIDNTPPTYSEPRIENITPTGYDVIVSGVSDENAGMGTVKIIVWTTEGGQDDIKEFEAEKQADGTTWKYHVEVTDHNNEYGPYNTTVKIEDKLGNEVVKNMTEIDVPAVTITFDSNGGTEAQPKTIKKGYDTVIGTLPTTSRVGHVFKGWWTEKENGTEITAASKIPAADVTYYAHWQAIQYTIKYNGNNNTSGSTADSIHTYDIEKEITENGYKREYTVTYNYNYSGSTNTSVKVEYDFQKWTRNQDGTGDSYTDKQKVLNLSTTDGDVLNFYAQWKNNSTTLPTPTRNDYQFFGWYADENCTTKVDDGGASYTPTKDITLYAKWETANYSTRTTTGTYYFKEFASAVNKADNTGSVITILQDHTDSSDKTVNKTVEINTNGKTATYTNSIAVENGKTVTFTGSGKIQRTDGGLVTNNGTVTVNGATLESIDSVIKGGNVTVSSGIVHSTGDRTEEYPAGITSENGNVTVTGGNISGSYAGIRSGNNITITGGTITGETHGISIATSNTVVTVGETSKTPASNTPIITGTNGYGINITNSTSTLNFYSGKIVGKTKATTRGVDTAFSVTNQSNVHYPNNYGAHTVTDSGMYETTLSIPVLNISPEVIYLNLDSNKTGQITATGSDYGTLTYSSNNETVARVSDTGMIEAKAVGEATITVTEANTGKTATCRVVVDTKLPIWTITLKQII